MEPNLSGSTVLQGAMAAWHTRNTLSDNYSCGEYSLNQSQLFSNATNLIESVTQRIEYGYFPVTYVVVGIPCRTVWIGISMLCSLSWSHTHTIPVSHF
jgi:hypothetical protein